MKAYRLNYDVIDCPKHPQLDMKERGYNILWGEAFPIADCWIFDVEKVIDPLPSYISFVKEVDYPGQYFIEDRDKS